MIWLCKVCFLLTVTSATLDWFTTSFGTKRRICFPCKGSLTFTIGPWRSFIKYNGISLNSAQGKKQQSQYVFVFEMVWVFESHWGLYVEFLWKGFIYTYVRHDCHWRIFPTCQVRVVRFYVSMLVLVLLVLVPSSHDHLLSAFPAGPPRSVFLAGPQPTERMPERMSEKYVRKSVRKHAIKNVTKYVRKKVRKDMSQNMLEKNVRNQSESMSENISERISEDMSEDLSERRLERMSENMSERISEDMSEDLSERRLERMSEDMSEKNVKICQKECRVECQTECQKICQKECQKICQKECQKICHKECQTECQKDCQKECQKILQKECPKKCQTECQPQCQTECQKICQKEC